MGVKSITGKTITSVDITDNEWKVASNLKYKENYYPYLVTEALATISPPIQIKKNQGSMSIKINWMLGLLLMNFHSKFAFDRFVRLDTMPLVLVLSY